MSKNAAMIGIESLETLQAGDPVAALALAIKEGVRAMGMALGAGQVERLARYLLLLAKWNRVYNLTSIVEPLAMVAPHLLDSLTPYPYIKGASVLDVGSGAGLPGIPLAIACPDKRFVLLDSRVKKTRYMTQAVIELGIVNVSVECARIEGYRPSTGFDTVISRAFASLGEFIALASHACARPGRMLAMKGALPEHECQALRASGERAHIHRVVVPGIEGVRQLVEIPRSS
jgi:16S rRNA (guanine527-N7)-methyltransferase